MFALTDKRTFRRVNGQTEKHLRIPMAPLELGSSGSAKTYPHPHCISPNKHIRKVKQLFLRMCSAREQIGSESCEC